MLGLYIFENWLAKSGKERWKVAIANVLNYLKTTMFIFLVGEERVVFRSL